VTRRVRRTPEASREHLLDAAERVFSRVSPDVAGLKEIAAEAGVSHGLVTHYFGTYLALVNATLERRLNALHAEITAQIVAGHLAGGASRSVPLDALLTFVSDKVAVRLILWGLLQENPPEVLQGNADERLARTTDTMTAQLRGLGLEVDRERIAFSIGAAVALAIGVGIGGPALEKSLGRPGMFTPGLPFRDELQRMISAYVLAPR
jgi:TetR/AcrR family transcriptional regulator, repressor for neighboring sulfatase